MGNFFQMLVSFFFSDNSFSTLDSVVMTIPPVHDDIVTVAQGDDGE